MKLIFCKHCEDIYRLFKSEEYQFCKCGKSGGKYIDDKNAVYFEKEENMSIPLGFNNYSFLFAINHQRFEGDGNKFESFVIPKKCESFVKINYPIN